MVKNVGYNDNPDLYSRIASQLPALGSQDSLRDIMWEFLENDAERAERYFSMLSGVNYEIAILYYIERHSQQKISSLLKISQSAVSKRLRSVVHSFRCFSKRPEQSPIQAKEDFEEILPTQFVEIAFFFYFEFQQDRVKYFLQTSQTGAANKFRRMVAHLEKLASLPDHGPYDNAILNSIGIGSPSGVLPSDNDVAHRSSLAKSYLGYFLYVKSTGFVSGDICKKNDKIRKGSLVKRPSIL